MNLKQTAVALTALACISNPSTAANRPYHTPSIPEQPVEMTMPFGMYNSDLENIIGGFNQLKDNMGKLERERNHPRYRNISKKYDILGKTIEAMRESGIKRFNTYERILKVEHPNEGKNSFWVKTYPDKGCVEFQYVLEESNFMGIVVCPSEKDMIAELSYVKLFGINNDGKPYKNIFSYDQALRELEDFQEIVKRLHPGSAETAKTSMQKFNTATEGLYKKFEGWIVEESNSVIGTIENILARAQNQSPPKRKKETEDFTFSYKDGTSTETKYLIFEDTPKGSKKLIFSDNFSDSTSDVSQTIEMIPTGSSFEKRCASPWAVKHSMTTEDDTGAKIHSVSIFYRADPTKDEVNVATVTYEGPMFKNGVFFIEDKEESDPKGVLSFDSTNQMTLFRTLLETQCEGKQSHLK